MKKNILVIGSGGREHAIIWKLSQSKDCGKIYAIPGNSGISLLAECHKEIGATEIDKIVDFVDAHKDIKLVVVAPDDPLAMGLVNRLNEKGHRAFGPTKEAAIIEASKSFSKDLMKKYQIPTANYQNFDNYDEALKYVSQGSFPVVVKASGLALGKGVLICQNFDEAKDALEQIMNQKVFGDSGNTVVIEEFLQGPEVSVLCFCDGKTVRPMVSAQDHKRAFDGDKGLNTGGMGTFSPSKFYTKEIAEYCEKNIFQKSVDALNKENRTFKGVIFFGLMLTQDGPKLLEYNARFGDPETQSVLLRLNGDLLEIFESCIDGNLSEQKIEWEDCASACVVIASGGYPQKYKKGCPITFGDLPSDIIVFHAGTKFAEDGKTHITSGGRVLGICTKAETIEKAREKIYQNIDKIQFEDCFYRKDIGIK